MAIYYPYRPLCCVAVSFGQCGHPVLEHKCTLCLVCVVLEKDKSTLKIFNMSTGGRSLKRSLAMVSGGAEPMIMRAPSLRRVETVNRKIKKAIERTKEKKFLDTLVHNCLYSTPVAVNASPTL